MKVLIIEDQFEIADSYRKILNEANIINDIALDAECGLQKIHANDYDVVLLDINLPAMSGAELLTLLRQEQRDLGIIMITARTEDELMVSSLNEGADDYLQKPVKYNELVARIHAVYRRMQSRASSDLVVENLRINFSSNIVELDGVVCDVTNKEFLILAKLAKEYPGYVSTEAITKTIYDEYVYDSSAIRVHIYNLKKKIKFANIQIENNKNRGYKLCFPQ